MNNDEIKLNFINAIRARGVFSKWNGDNNELITKCPFCGDNNKINDGHLYISANYSKDEPMLYHCFKCNVGGIITPEIAEYFINEDEIISSISKLNNSRKYNIKLSKHGKTYMWKIPEPDLKYKKKIDYINKRLGIKIDREFYNKSRIILDFIQFIKINNITPYSEKSFIYILQNNYVGFLSSKGTHIWFRNIADSGDIRWIKYPIVKTDSKNFYSIANEVNPLSTDTININLSEGIFDCLSIWKNLNHDTQNDVNIAVGSSDYTGMINYLISLGFIGSNINLNIYSDNDNNNTTSLKYHHETLKRYKILFGEINVYYNIINKDCGVPINQIRLKREIIK